MRRLRCNIDAALRYLCERCGGHPWGQWQRVAVIFELRHCTRCHATDTPRLITPRASRRVFE